MARFNFTVEDLKTTTTLTSAIHRQQTSVSGPLRTTASVSGVPRVGATTYDVSQIAMGNAAFLPQGFTANQHMQSLSSDLAGLFRAEGGINTVMGETRATLLASDIRTNPGFDDGRFVEGSSSWLNNSVDTGGTGSATSAPAPVSPTTGSGTTVNVQGITVDQSIADQLGRMIDAARADGITLSGSGWRSNARQIQLRTINGCPDVWDASPSSCRVPTAIPGTSLHEQGLAIDFDNSSSRSSPVCQWLTAHAAQYGFYNLPSEPWHWSTTGN